MMTSVMPGPRFCSSVNVARLAALSPLIKKSLLFLARYFSIVPFGPLSMHVWWPFEEYRTCIPFLVLSMSG